MTKILIVDDTPDNLYAYEKCLQDGVEILTATATSCQAALQTLLQEQVSVILTDVQMPDMNGFDTVQRIKELS